MLGLVPLRESCVVGLQASRNREYMISKIVFKGRKAFNDIRVEFVFRKRLVNIAKSRLEKFAIMIANEAKLAKLGFIQYLEK